jgi:exosortase A-associated hydrolase 2
MSAENFTCRGEPFFLETSIGLRFCVYYRHGTEYPQGGILLVPAFAEEMNKSRRLTALQARALAKLGWAVLSIDLYGSGDSAGDFGDASWDIWKEDLRLGVAWLRTKASDRLALWGVRAGALLALDALPTIGATIDRVVLWHPVVDGETFLTQFLRLQATSEALTAGRARVGSNDLRERLASGRAVEVCGYEVSPGLAQALGGRLLVNMPPLDIECHWLHVVSAMPAPSLPPREHHVADSWTARGVDLRVHLVAGPTFWGTTYEIVECPALLAATSAIFLDR